VPESSLRIPVVAVVDVETTGIDPSADAIVEVAASLYSPVDGLLSSFSSLVNPGRPIPASASGVHHIRTSDVADAPTRTQALEALLHFVQPARCFVAHNAEFDRSFLPELADRRWICTMRLARHLWPEADDHKNQTLRYWLPIDETPLLGVEMHRAEADTRVTGQIFLRVVNDYRERFGSVTLGALQRLCWSPIPMTVMPRGTRKGTPIAELPESDISYWLGREDTEPDLRWNLEQELYIRYPSTRAS
jgi:exodeoxyribonuclease X